MIGSGISLRLRWENAGFVTWLRHNPRHKSAAVRGAGIFLHIIALMGRSVGSLPATIRPVAVRILAGL